MHSRGFTLIETLIYLGLFSIIIGGVLVTAYQVIEGSTRTEASVIIEEEANFLLRKIEWVLSGVASVNNPPPGGSGSNLSVDKLNFSSNPIIFDFDSGNLRLKKGSGGTMVLNSSRVTVINLSFQHLPPNGNKPAAVKASFLVNNEPFEILKYLRK